jgi:hypothetical protein
LRLCWCGALSPTRGWVCRLQLLLAQHALIEISYPSILHLSRDKCPSHSYRSDLTAVLIIWSIFQETDTVLTVCPDLVTLVTALWTSSPLPFLKSESCSLRVPPSSFEPHVRFLRERYAIAGHTRMRTCEVGLRLIWNPEMKYGDIQVCHRKIRNFGQRMFSWNVKQNEGCISWRKLMTRLRHTTFCMETEHEVSYTLCMNSIWNIVHVNNYKHGCYTKFRVLSETFNTGSVFKWSY